MRTRLTKHANFRRYGATVTERWDEPGRYTLTVQLGLRTWRVWR